jgi:TolB protein
MRSPRGGCLHRDFTRGVALAAWLAAGLAWGGCGGGDGADEPERRDSAVQLPLDLGGSLQNPAWSPTGDRLVLTRFAGGYNEEPADLVLCLLADASARTLVADGSGNVNLPGSSWSAARGEIVFSSSRDPHDEIYAISADGQPGDEAPVTARAGLVAYEPTFSPDGAWVVFESHQLDQEGQGVITKRRVDGTGGDVALTDPADDCRQPNWAPAGGHILYQRLAAGQWELWVMDEDGGQPRQVTSGPGDKTDASFSPDGARIVYSSNEGGQAVANLYVVPVVGGDSLQVTDWDGYDGAPSWSPDGARLAFESYPDDPDGAPGTILWLVDAPGN